MKKSEAKKGQRVCITGIIGMVDDDGFDLRMVGDRPEDDVWIPYRIGAFKQFQLISKGYEAKIVKKAPKSGTKQPKKQG